MIKLNVDAAVSKDHTILAVVARDTKGEILKAWTTDHQLCEPGQAEAETILWALKLALTEKFNKIIVVGDAKACFDFLNTGTSTCWTVCNVLYNALEIGKSFQSCTFGWVRREANGVAHAIAKFASPLRSSFCWNHDVCLLSY